MDQLLPDVLKELWQSVEEKKLTGRRFYDEQKRGVREYRRIWENALLLEGRRNLKKSLVRELGSYLRLKSLSEVERQAKGAMLTTETEWHKRVDPRNRHSVEQFYDETQVGLFELMWWHGLGWDDSPLAYVTALKFAQLHGGRAYMDFGSGVCSGGILFARHGFDVSLADISTPLLDFGRWRFAQRGLSARFIDMKSSKLAKGSLNFITAMDVFEHLFDPVSAAEQLWASLKPGGFLFGRFDTSEDQSQHIVRDFGPTLRHMKKLGFVQVWQDEWLWGHLVFQKT